MNIRINITLDLNPEDWALARGARQRRAVREDVRRYVLNLIRTGGVFGEGNGKVPITITENN